MDNLLKPRIRFKGFTDVWEQRKLGDECFELIAGGDIDKTRSVNNGKYPIYANALTNDGIVGYYNDSYRVKSPAVTITGRGEIGYAMARNTDFTPVVRLISLRSKHNNYFLANAINLLNVVSESTGVPQLTIPQVEKFDIYFPKNINEEIKLGRLFYEIDNLITLHQRKCEKLINIKQSLLEKMFPKNFSNLPEIRFKGFTDVWEQRKLENIFNYERPDKYIVSSAEYLEFGPTPVLTANKAFILGYTTEKNKYVNSHESIIFDDFTLDTKFVDFPYMVKSSAIKILTLKDEKKDNIRFNFELLSNHRFNMLGHARHYISVVQPEEVFTTNKQEQNKIGELFTNLDNLITLHQRKSLFNLHSWEQRKAKDLCSITTGKSNTQDQVQDGKYPFYIRSDVPVRSNRYLYDEEAVITIGDGNIGRVFHYVNGKFDLHQRCYKMADFKALTAKYFYYYFSTKFYERAMSMTAKATVDSVRLEMISDMEIKFPKSTTEQTNISELLTNLDNLITLHQRKKNREGND